MASACQPTDGLMSTWSFNSVGHAVSLRVTCGQHEESPSLFWIYRLELSIHWCHTLTWYIIVSQKNTNETANCLLFDFEYHKFKWKISGLWNLWDLWKESGNVYQSTEISIRLMEEEKQQIKCERDKWG